jgi:hypothetical protein
MTNFRVFLSVSVFFLGLYLLFDIFLNGFDIWIFISSLISFISAHYIFPKKYDADSYWVDLIESIVHFPFKAIAAIIRAISSGANSIDDYD